MTQFFGIQAYLPDLRKGLINQKKYQNLLQDLKGIIAHGQYQAYKAVDNIKVQAYWQIGERIVREDMKNKERAGYGNNIIYKLTLDLAIKSRVLYRAVDFFKLYPIVSTLSTQLSWSHYVELIELESQEERSFYENKIINHSWSVRELGSNISNHLYQKIDCKDIEEILKTKLPSTYKIKRVIQGL